MPEVIEIRKYADNIRKYVKNKYLKELNIVKGRYTKKPFLLYNEINNELPLKIIDIKTKGKFLYFILEKNYYIYSTLGLTGGWVFKKNKYIFPKLIDYIDKKELNSWKRIALNNSNVEFILDNVKIYYFDPLSFGTIKIVNNEEELNQREYLKINYIL